MAITRSQGRSAGVQFDDEKFSAVAKNSDLGAVAINLALGLGAVAFALEAIRDGRNEDLTKRIAQIRAAADEMDKVFEKVTGYALK